MKRLKSAFIRVHQRPLLFFFLLSIFLSACTSTPQPRVDPQLASEIEKIKAIDNHAHPVRPGNPPDNDFDALPVDHMEPYPHRRRSPSKNVGCR
jgi:hypothetical protein